MATPGRPPHNMALFDILVSHMREREPELRVGAMFGCPAVYIGRRLAFCVYGDVVGAKVPEADATRLIATNEVTAFRPYGRPAMKEWIELKGPVPAMLPILMLAMAHARALGNRGPKPRTRRLARP